jgi:hypothetical protein
MRRKLFQWLLTLAAGTFIINISTCARSAIQGAVDSVIPCDILNCTDPSYVDPCMFIQCNRTAPTQQYGNDDSDSTSTSTTDTSTTKSIK